MPHSSRPAVALLIETSNAYARGVLQGITSYQREHQPWSIYLPEQERGAKPPGWLRNWQGDGIIARIETEEIAKAIRQTGLPVIDVSAARRVPGIPWVETDDTAIARLAAEHLMERGFQHFAFCGEPDFNWSNWREEGFVSVLADRGQKCELFHARSRTEKGYSWNREQRRLRKWVDNLPRPIGIFACYDIRAQQLLDVCRELNISVPEEIAVLGVDNDELLCNLCTPPLSSVIPDSHQTGYRAAELLDTLLKKKSITEEACFIPPLGIAARQSTDILAIDDPDLVKALHLIRTRSSDGINVNDLLKEIPLSRRVFEFRFQKVLGCTPHEMIVRTRMDRVKELLRETDMTLDAIAASVGFTHVEYLTTSFRKQAGVTPSIYRKQVRSP
ncbi:MAG: DNA-binding transcriptional regulator [Planctomycetaceae bacterium]|nr:DNA-binding transcriptional regulator [Planctomycetaceae bacterium]